MESTVKTYKKVKAYRKDLERMQRDGWRVVGTTTEKRPRGCLASPFSGAHMTIVTYERVKH